VSYLKQLPCETCYTYSIYYFPKKPTEKYCYCSFRDEIGEQIAREIEAECKQGGAMACGISGNYQCSCSGAAAIAKREPNQVTKDAIEEARKMK